MNEYNIPSLFSDETSVDAKIKTFFIGIKRSTKNIDPFAPLESKTIVEKRLENL